MERNDSAASTLTRAGAGWYLLHKDGDKTVLKNLGFPVISASRSKEQPYRINRLQTLLGWIQGRASSDHCSWEIEHNLLGLNDHQRVVEGSMAI